MVPPAAVRGLLQTRRGRAAEAASTGVLRSWPPRSKRCASQGARGHSKRTCELLSTPRFARYLPRRRGAAQDRPERSSAREEARRQVVITSNDDTLSAEDLALGYKQLMRVEQCWHTGQRWPAYAAHLPLAPHRIARTSPVRAGLLVERIAENPPKDTWRNIRDQLETSR